MSAEEWRPVPGVPGAEASSEGRIRRLVCAAFHGPAPEGRRIASTEAGD